MRRSRAREEIIVDSLHQWIFGANNDHVYMLLHDEVCKGIKICGSDVHVFAYTGRASVAWCNEKLLNFRTLGDFPGKCVFATARTKEKDLHERRGVVR